VPPRTGDAAPTQRGTGARIDPTLVEQPAKRRSGRRRRAEEAESERAAPAASRPDEPAPPPIDPALAPPGYHIYRPSSATSGNGTEPGEK
jgi:hypothetical protein